MTETQFPLPPGDEVSLKCTPGHTLTGDTTVTCQEGTNFSFAHSPYCTSGLFADITSLARIGDLFSYRKMLLLLMGLFLCRWLYHLQAKLNCQPFNWEIAGSNPAGRLVSAFNFF